MYISIRIKNEFRWPIIELESTAWNTNMRTITQPLHANLHSRL